MKLPLKKQEKGFTIIEVLIVLAIAGLIVLIVFLAVPSLQRNSRNTQRKNDASSLAGAAQEAINNNNGNLAALANTTHTQDGAATAIPDVIENVRRTQLLRLDYTWVAPGTAATLPATIGTDQVLLRNNLKCNDNGATPYVDPGTNTTNVATTIGNGAGNIATTNGATPRTVVLIYPTERQGGLTGVCQNL